jgi:hypothetical protein
MTGANIQRPAFLYNHFGGRAIYFSLRLHFGIGGKDTGCEKRLCRIRNFRRKGLDFRREEWLPFLLASDRAPMAMPCKVTGCKNDSPPALAEQQQVCVLHFTLSIEASCAEMRRETALGNAPHERQKEIMRFITESGERLARVATSGLHLTDDLKARILSTFLTLMNLRENLDRANMRSSFGRTGQNR